MGFIGKDDTGDPTNYDFVTATTSTAGNVDLTTSDTLTSNFTIPSLFYCAHCPRRFEEEQDYEFHIIWHMLDDIIRTLKNPLPKLPIPKKKPWFSKLRDIEANANLAT